MCREALQLEESGADLTAVRLDNQARGRVCCSPSFGGHLVPISLLHRIQTLDHAYRYYSAPVSSRTPYEKLHAEQEKGTLPPNLHIQARAKRFDPFSEDAP